MIKKYYLFFNIEYLLILVLNLSAHDSVFNTLSKDITNQYPEINLFYPNNEYIHALTYCLISEKKNLHHKWNDYFHKYISYEKKTNYGYYHQKGIKNFLKQNCTDYITTAIKLWKIDGAMNLLVAYEIHRFHAGFDYDFTDITNLETFKLAYKKGYIKNQKAQEKFKILFTETVKLFCSHYTFAKFIIDPRGIKVPIPFENNTESLQFNYENKNLTIQNSSTEYIFKHDNDSLTFISSKKIPSPLKKTKWKRSGNIGTDIDAKMRVVKNSKYYGFEIYPASIGCYRDIILEYSHEGFYGFATIDGISQNPFSHSLYFFYGYLPQQTENTNFSLKEFFLLHEMIYYKNYISLLKLRSLRLQRMSRINLITSEMPYLKHITDTFEVGPIDNIPEPNTILRKFFHFLSIAFLVITKVRYLKTNLCLIFLNFMLYFAYNPFRYNPFKYKNLYIWCGLE